MLFTKWNWKDYVTVQKEELREELEAKYQAQIQEEKERIRQLEEENRRLRGEAGNRSSS
jgi:predicted nuclease with TOPRIM domain